VAVDQDLVIRRRVIRQADLLLIRQLIEDEGVRGRSHISNRLCEIWNWRQANGRFRQIACRDLLRQLQGKGLVELPTMRCAARRPGYRNRVPRLDRVEAPLSGALASIQEEIQVHRVQGGEREDEFKGLIGTYHYLGYRQAQGARVKYLALYQGRPLACLSFGPAAFHLEARDRFIGWSAPQRRERLAWVVNNDRFLILPWVEVPHLASWLLSRCLRRLRSDWQQLYCQDVALAETFVEKERFSGGAYAAANWTCIGQSCGRGRNDRLRRRALPLKTIWVYALRADFRRVLCAPVSEP
jgi:Druantia protein DruA